MTARQLCLPPQAVLLTVVTTLTICSLRRFIVWVMGCPTIRPSGFDAMIAHTVSPLERHDVAGERYICSVILYQGVIYQY